MSKLKEITSEQIKAVIATDMKNYPDVSDAEHVTVCVALLMQQAGASQEACEQYIALAASVYGMILLAKDA